MSTDGPGILGATAAITTSSAPTVGKVNRYNATTGAISVTLPALSSLRVGSSVTIEKDTLDVSNNTVTATRAGSDLFDDGTTSLVLNSSGAQRRLQVVSPSGTKVWKRMEGFVTPGGGLSGNSPITPGTNTKITYDSKGLVTAGTSATQDDIGDGTSFKQYSNTDKTKLAGVAAGATANSANAFLLDRANHTGTQTSATISDFVAAVTNLQAVPISAQTGSYTLALTDNYKAVEVTSTTAASNVAIGSASSGGSGTSVDVPVPAGIAINNIIVVALYVEANPGVAVTGVPTGFFEAPDSPADVSSGSQSHRLHVYWKRQSGATGAGETTGNYTFTIASGLSWRRGNAMRFQGVIREGNPWEVTANAAKTTTSDGLSPPISDTTLGDHRLWVWCVGKYTSATSTTTAAGFTESFDTADGLSAYVGEQVAAGSSGSLQATFSTNGASSAWLGALIPGLSVVVPANGTVAFPVGSVMNISQQGPAAVTLLADPGVSLRSAASLTTRGQYSELSVRKQATDTWLVTGDML